MVRSRRVAQAGDDGRERKRLMATREFRISEFNTGTPPANLPFELLCEDHSGTYILPFAWRWLDGAWFGPRNVRIDVTIVGWRERV